MNTLLVLAQVRPVAGTVVTGGALKVLNLVVHALNVPLHHEIGGEGLVAHRTLGGLFFDTGAGLRRLTGPVSRLLLLLLLLCLVLLYRGVVLVGVGRGLCRHGHAKRRGHGDRGRMVVLIPWALHLNLWINTHRLEQLESMRTLLSPPETTPS